MSSGLQKVQVTAQSAFSTVERNTAKAQRSMTNTGRSVMELNKRLDELKRTRDISINKGDIRTANKEIYQLEKRLDKLQNMGKPKGTSSGIGIAAGLTAFGLTAALTSGLAYSAKAGLQGGAQKMSYEVLAGKDKGGKLYNDLTKFAQDSIFGNEVYQSAQTMLAFGVSVDKVLPSLKMLGDISMGNREKLQSLTLAFSQTRSAGRLMGQDLLQYTAAGFNPLHELSIMTGKSMVYLKDQMEKGAISADMVVSAIEHATSKSGMFFDMTNKMAETPFGKWQALQGQIEGVALKLGSNLAPAISIFIDKYGVPFVNWLSSSVDWLSRNWSWIKELVGVLGSAYIAIKTYTAAQAIANAVMAANPVMLLVGALGILIYKLTETSGAFDAFSRNQNEMVNSQSLKTMYATAGAANGQAYADAFAAKAEETQMDRMIAFSKRWGIDYAWVELYQKTFGGGITTDETDRIYKQGKYDYQNYTGKTNALPSSKFIANTFHSNFFKSSPQATSGNPAGVTNADFNQVSGRNDNITGGGARIINYTFNDAIVKGTVINAGSAEEAAGLFDDKVAESILRIMNGNGNEN